MVKLPNDERTVLVAIGESGSGKSNLLNLILNTPGEHSVFFPEGDGAEACTLESGEDSGCWRGDPSRQVTVFDSPGLGADDIEEDLHNLQQILNLIKDLSYISCILIVVKSGTSRFLSQHQKMFENLEKVFGCGVWANVVLDLSWTCSSRDKRNFEKWVEKLREKFPEAKCKKLDTVYINTPDREFDTLEELWKLIDEMDKYVFSGQRIPQITAQDNKPIESPDISITSYDSAGSLGSGSLSQSLQDLRASRQSWNELRPEERSSSNRHHSGPNPRHSVDRDIITRDSASRELLSRHSVSREMLSRHSDKVMLSCSA